MTGKTTFTPEIEQEALAYIATGYEELDHVIPSHVGMSIALNVNKSTLYKWAEDNHGTFSDTLAKCNDKQHMLLIAKGLTNEFSGTITKIGRASCRERV